MEESTKHPRHIVGYDGSFQDLVEAIGSMTYDQVSLFIGLLAHNIEAQAIDDIHKRKRHQVAAKLFESASHLRNAESMMKSAWKICRPYMKEK